MNTEQEQRANDLLQALAAQRNAAQDQAANLHAELMAAKREIDRLKVENDALKKPPEPTVTEPAPT